MQITPHGALDSLHPVVAILPFRPRSGDQTHQVVGDAIADDLISALSRRRDWRVVSRLSTSAFRAPRVEATLEQIQRALKASFVVDGSYSVRAGQLRMQVELTNVRNGTVMWAGRTSLPLDSLFAGDDDALISVVYEIG